jgi:hypothetical protein
MLRSVACFLLLATPASASELLTELYWTHSPGLRREERVEYVVSVGGAQWNLGTFDYGNGGEFFEANANTVPQWGEIVHNLVNEPSSRLVINSTSQGGTHEFDIPVSRLLKTGEWSIGDGWWSVESSVSSFSGLRIDRIEFEDYYTRGPVYLRVFGSVVPEPNSLLSIPILAVGFLLRRRARAFA